MTIPPLPADPAELAAHTEQALVELVYVRVANDVIGSAMANLDQALNITQSVLNILQALQNLHNNIDVLSKSAFPFIFSTAGGIQLANHPNTLYVKLSDGQYHSVNPTLYQKLYNQAASAYFGQAIDPFFVFLGPNDPSFKTFKQTLSSLRTSLKAEIDQMLAMPGGTQNAQDPASLLFNITKVYNEIPATTGTHVFSALQKWVLDNYNAHGSTATALGGQLQNDLTFAITAAENLNDTQKEHVRSFLFIFQQYYQSAAAVISGITSIIKQMAQKIAQ